MPTITLLKQINTPSGTLGKSIEATADVYVELVDAVVPLATDTEFTIAIPTTGLKAFYMVADKAVTVETNSGSAADQTFTLAANVPVAWADGDGAASPVTDAITSIFTTAAAAAVLNIRALYDPTP